MVSMGVKGFELLLPEGIGERTAVVLQGAAGDEKDLFAYQFLAEGLKAYEGVMVVLSRTSPAEFREEMRKHGVKCEAHEEEGSLVIVDWYSYKKGRIDGVQIDGSVFSSSQSLLNLEIAITDATKRLVPYPKRRAVLDVLSPSLKMFSSNEVYTFAQKLRTRLRTESIASLLILEKGMHPDDIVQSIHQSFDGVIDFVKERKEDRVERRIGLLFIRGISYEPKYTGYRLVDDRIVVAESGETDEEKTVRMLKRQEELLAKDPGNVMIWFSRGSLFTDIGEFEKGLEAFDKVLELDRDHIGAWNGRAYVLSQLGRTEDATESYKNALVLVAKQVDEDHYERLTSKEGIEETEPEKVEPEKVQPEKVQPEEVEVKKRICALCGAQALATAEKCPECGTEFARFEGKREDEGILDYLASMGEEEGITDEGVDDLLRRRRERAAKRKPARARIRKGVGLTNGLPRERVAKGLVNGLGRVNGLVNGLANAKSGLTNGLTNGSGFTNGLGSGRFIRENKKSRWKVFIVPLIAMILLSTAFLMPESPGPRVFGVDGYFEDWDDDAILYSRSADVNPNVDINATGVETDESAQYVFLFAQVQPGNQVLAGNLQSKLGDFLRVFIDSDRSDETGYKVAGTGADYLVQVVGRDEGQGSVARMSAAYRYIGQDQTDWNAWEHESSVLVAPGKGEVANKIEIAIPKSMLPDPDAALYVFQMEDWSGDVDFGDYRMAGAKGVMYITQESGDQEVIETQTPRTLLTLELKKVGYKHDTSDAITLETVRGMLLGTLPVSEVQSVTLETVDASGGPWTGSVSGNGMVVFQDIGYSFTQGSKTDFTVDVVLSSSAASGATIGFRILSPDDVVISTGAATLESVPTDHDLSYVSSVPSDYTVDGGFSEWMTAMSDGMNEPSTGLYDNVDIRQYDLNSTQDEAFFYVKVGGRVLEGRFTPQKSRYIPDHVTSKPDSDRDSIPDDEDDNPFDFDNDGTPDLSEGGDVDSDGVTDWPQGNDRWLETTVDGRLVRIYIGPTIPPPVLRGEDTVRIYVDSDKDPTTGYFVGDIGADFLVEIAGKNGEPLAGRSTMREHVGGPGSYQWVTPRSANVALDLQNMEVSVNISGLGFLQDFPAYFETIGWEDRRDDAIGTKSLTRGDYGGFAARFEGNYAAHIADISTTSQLVRFEYEQGELSWGLPTSLAIDDGQESFLISDLKESSLQVGGNEARFDDLFENLDVSVVYSFFESRIKEEIILREGSPLFDAFDEASLELSIPVHFSSNLKARPLLDGTQPTGLETQEQSPETAVSESFSTTEGIGFFKGSYAPFHIEGAFAYDSSGATTDCEYTFDMEGDEPTLFLRCQISWLRTAHYPVVIDPTVVLENNPENEEQGYNITTGDFNGDGAEDIAVGAPGNQMRRTSDKGAVYIFYGGSSFDPGYDLMILSPSGSARFGAALASGDVNDDTYDDLIVGDPGYSSDTGRVYLYYGANPMDATEDKTFDAPDSDGRFGFCIDTGDLNAPTDDYDDVVMTAPKYNTSDGRAYVYFGNSGTNMDTTNDGVLDPPSSVEDGSFGWSVTIGEFEGSGDSDDDVVIGEPWYDDTTTDEGRIHVFYGGSGTSFEETVDLTGSPDPTAGDGRYGYAMDMGDSDEDADEDLFVGAPYSDSGGGTNNGLVYKVDAGNGDAGYDSSTPGTFDNYFFGVSVKTGNVDGDGTGKMDVLIGARENTNDVGHVWLYFNGMGGGNANIGGSSNGDRFGYALASGDVNDDGTYWDLIVGIPGFSAGADDGAVSVYYGSASFDVVVDLRMYSAVEERLGYSLANGDFNNDGYDDLAAGAPNYDGGDGAAYIYFGSSSGISDHSPPDLTYRAEYSGEQFGWNLTVGDFNGDDYDDLLVGAPSNDEGQADGGRAYVFYGGDGRDMDGDGVDVDIAGNSAGEQMGWSVAAGNFDGDSDDDALLGAPGYDSGKGRAYVYSYFASPTENTPNATLHRGDAERFGSSVAAMNYDEDGYDDALIGAPLNDSDGHTNKGVAFIYRGAQNMGEWFPPPGAGGNASATAKFFGDNTSNQSLFNLTQDDEIYYVVSPGEIMWVYQFDNSGISGIVESITLYVQYQTDGGYGGTGSVTVFIPGQGYLDTGITPGNEPQDTDASYDLYANGLTSISDVFNVQVNFSNNDGSKKVYWDYVKVNVTVLDWHDTNITLKGQNIGDQAGFSVASGDFDGDSSYADDAVLGAPFWFDGTNDTGAVYLFNGSSIRTDADGTLTTPDRTVVGPGSTDAMFGWSLASSDFNGDQYDDLLVGAPHNDTSNGAVYAYVGPTSTLGNPPTYTVDGEEDELLGHAVVGGNYLTVGYDDVAAGGPFFNSTDNDGRVVIEAIPEFANILVPLMLVIAIPILIRRRLRR